MRIWTFLTLVLLTGQCACHAQQQEALGKLRQRYSEQQIQDLRLNGHHKFVGLLLFYSASFEVIDQGVHRRPTPEEIEMIDLHQFDSLRTEKEDVAVFGQVIGKQVVLFSRDRFETLLLSELNAEDRSAYLVDKSRALSLRTGKAH